MRESRNTAHRALLGSPKNIGPEESAWRAAVAGYAYEMDGKPVAPKLRRLIDLGLETNRGKTVVIGEREYARRWQDAQEARSAPPSLSVEEGDARRAVYRGVLLDALEETLRPRVPA